MASWKDIEPGDILIFVDRKNSTSIYVVISVEHEPKMKIGWYVVSPGGKSGIQRPTIVESSDETLNKHFHIIKPGAHVTME